MMYIRPVVIKEWQILDKIKDDPHSYAGFLLTKAENRRLLDKKLSWFFLNGPVSVFYVINEVYGELGLTKFQNFLSDYILGENGMSKYLPSKNLKNEVNEIRKMSVPTIENYLASWAFYLNRKESENDKKTDG